MCGQGCGACGEFGYLVSLVVARVYFTESQRIDQIGIKIFMAILTCSILAPFLMVDWGSTSVVYKGIALVGVMLTMILVNVMVFVMTFETKITEEGMLYRYPPLIWKWKLASFEDLQEVKLTKYLLWSQFGGPGYKRRIFGTGRGIVIKGNQGVQLIFKNGKKLLLGTQKPNEIQIGLGKAQEANRNYHD